MSAELQAVIHHSQQIWFLLAVAAAVASTVLVALVDRVVVVVDIPAHLVLVQDIMATFQYYHRRKAIMEEMVQVEMVVHLQQVVAVAGREQQVQIQLAPV
jgi:hypothetical protein